MICPKCGNKKLAMMRNWPAMGVWTCVVCNKAWAEYEGSTTPMGAPESKAAHTKRLQKEGKG